MNSNPPNPEQQKTHLTYTNDLEGQLQFLVDRSIFYAQQEKDAKTSLKREMYRKKRVKNNKKFVQLLLRTPNAYNPLMEKLAESVETAEQDLALDKETMVRDATRAKLESIASAEAAAEAHATDGTKEAE
jgi:hypothetical protein